MTENPSSPFRAVALLDRDGTINKEVNYLSDPDQLELLPRAAQAIKILNQEGIAAILTTNQSGIPRGYFTEETLALVHQRLQELLAKEDAHLDGIYFAPCLPHETDLRRKPFTGMYDAAVKDLGLEGLPVYGIGDKPADVEFAHNCGGIGILTLCGQSDKDAVEPSPKTFIADSLFEAVYQLLCDQILVDVPEDQFFQRKFNDLFATSRLVKEDKAAGRKVVLANGCFDLLHGGHISYLESCKAFGDKLVLAVNSNASINRLKGEGRPVLDEMPRLQMLANLKCVDYLTVFHPDSADHVLEILHPDIHAKGTDYTSDKVPERQTSIRLGIETKIAGMPKENSSRDIIEVVVERTKKGLI